MFNYEYIIYSPFDIYPTLEDIGVVFQIIIGLCLVWIGITANKIYKEQHNFLKNKISDGEKEAIKENYYLVKKALTEIRNSAEVSTESWELIYKSYIDAELELPEGLCNEIKEKIYSIAKRITTLDCDIITKNKQNSDSNEENKGKNELIKQIKDVKENEIYSNYLKISKR
jgi:hypothetical protein